MNHPLFSCDLQYFPNGSTAKEVVDWITINIELASEGNKFAMKSVVTGTAILNYNNKKEFSVFIGMYTHLLQKWGWAFDLENDDCNLWFVDPNGNPIIFKN